MSIRPGPVQRFEGVSSCSYEGQASSEVLRVIEENKLPTWQKNGLALCFLGFVVVVKTGSHVVQADLELLSFCLSLPSAGIRSDLPHQVFKALFSFSRRAEPGPSALSLSKTPSVLVLK